MTSQTLASLAQSEGVARQELLQSQSNVNRVSKEIVAFARRSDVSVDPQYGTWKDQAVVAPVGPPSQYLLAAVSGQTHRAVDAAEGHRVGIGGHRLHWRQRRDGSTGATAPAARREAPAPPAAEPPPERNVMPPVPPRLPRVDVVGLGPAGPELITAEARALMSGPAEVVFRTRRHPAAEAFPGARSFDHHYEEGRDLRRRSTGPSSTTWSPPRSTTGSVVYAVPGSPMVAERTVVLLREHPSVVGGELDVVVHPSVSFLDLAFARLGVDPVASGSGWWTASASPSRRPVSADRCWSPSVGAPRCCRTSSCPPNRHRR